MQPTICILDSCETPTGYPSARGMCRRHYRLWLKYGDPFAARDILRAPNGSGTFDGRYYRCPNHDGTPRLVHRELMAAFLGRPLLSTEHVHHRDGNRLNNALSNLQLVTKAEHNHIHFFGKKRAGLRGKYLKT